MKRIQKATISVVLTALGLFSAQAAFGQCTTCGLNAVSLPKTPFYVNQEQTDYPGSGSFAVVYTDSVPAGSSVPVNNTTGLAAWCVEDPTTPFQSGNNVVSWSSLDPAQPLRGTDPAVWNKINYILNNKLGTYVDVQRAIWTLLGRKANIMPTFDAATPTGTPGVTIADQLVANANANSTFVPGPGQVLGVILGFDGPGGFQELMTEVPVPDCGVIGDFVWNDANGNGIQDADEKGIDGVTVHLRQFGSSTDVATQVTTTKLGSAGYYRFAGLCSGTYAVVADTPANMTPTASCTLGTAGCDKSTNSDTSPASVTINTTSPVTASDLTIDFGFKPVVVSCVGQIGNTLWRDTNNDGLQSVGEAGIANVTVQLFASGNLTPVQTATTDVNGNYQFTNLCAGSYVVKPVVSTLPANVTPTTPTVGIDRLVDSNGPLDGSGAPVTLTANNSVDNTIDFGYRALCTGSIGNFVWNDMNRNGLQDAGEPGISGVTLTLKDATGKVLATTITDAAGAYSFQGVCTGSFTVVADTKTVPSGFTPTTSPAGSDTTKDSNPNPASVILTNGQNDSTIDFGFAALCNASVGDRVWYDADGNGLQDAWELGLSGLTVQLRKSSDSTLLATTITDAKGAYMFSGLCPGTYKVEVVPPATVPGSTRGLMPTTVNAPGTTTATDSNANPYTVTVPASTAVTDVDFGFKPNTTAAAGCTYTWGYWKNHDENWPVSSLNLGYQTYGSAELMGILATSVAGDSSVKLAHQLIAAKLNLLAGAWVPKETQIVIQSADDALKGLGRLPANVQSNTLSSLSALLDAYNMGTVGGVGHCSDDLSTKVK